MRPTPAFVGAFFHREALKKWRHRLRRFYAATAPRQTVFIRASPCGLAAYPGFCRGFFSSRCAEKNGGIGGADFMPPPPLGSRVVPGVVTNPAQPRQCRSAILSQTSTTLVSPSWERGRLARGFASFWEMAPVVSELQLASSWDRRAPARALRVVSVSAVIKGQENLEQCSSSGLAGHFFSTMRVTAAVSARTVGRSLNRKPRVANSGSSARLACSRCFATARSTPRINAGASPAAH